MASTVEKLAKSRVRIEATVEAQDFMKAIETAYQKTRGRYAVQGFRRGRAPRAIIERFYGKEVFYEDAIEELWRDAFESAIAEHDLSVVSCLLYTSSKAPPWHPTPIFPLMTAYEPQPLRALPPSSSLAEASGTRIA